MANVLVSVVIPSYNCGAFLDDAVGSVLGQTYANLELVIVDDGSQDDSAAIVRTWQSKTDKIVYLKHEQNQGLAAARNTGIRQARGELIALLDADDVWLPDKLEVQLENMRQLDVDAVFSNWFVWDGVNKKLAYEFDVYRLFSGYDGLCAFIRHNFGNSSTVLVKRSAFDTVGFFDETLSSGEDYDLWLRFLLKGLKLGFMPEALAYYRQHPAQMSVKLFNMRASRLAIFKRVARTRPSLLVTCPVLTKKLLTHQVYALAYKTLARRN